MKLLSRQEEILLLSIVKLQENAYGVTIREYISELTGKYWSIGSIYVPIDRLLEKGFIEAFFRDVSNIKGGRKQRFYRLTREGERALEELMQLQKSLWEALPISGSKSKP